MKKENFLIRRSPYHRGEWHLYLGITLSASGFLWLAKNIGWIPATENGLAIHWPLVIIVLGLFITLHTRRHGKEIIKKQIQ